MKEEKNMIHYNDLKQLVRRHRTMFLILTAFIAGFGLREITREPVQSPAPIPEASAEREVHDWTCSMHPQIRLTEPGQCPICGMDLIPVITSDDRDLSPREIQLSPTAVKLAAIQVAPVERRFVTKDTRMTGKVAYDETLIRNITSWLPGRLDRLYVDFTGITVTQGDHLVEIYSPELYTTQEELIQALAAVRELKKSTLSTVRETALRTVESSREKLRLLGLTEVQIHEFEKQGKPADHVTIYSPIGGIVIHKDATEGMYVTTGSPIYTVADLSRVWVLLDVYESDLEWIRYGQDIEFSTEAYPGEIFKGKIAFIDPILNNQTRSVKVRVNIPNTDGKLKPDMFVRAVVHSEVAIGGKVMDPSLAGKYICPMHPEIIKDKPDVCDICGMDLVKAESLGYANPGIAEPPLIIPASAPLITGRRAVVYVKVPDKEGIYEGREIVLGPRAGEYYHVREGIHEGEFVVVNGNFKIDSAIQILARPSMMNPQGGGPAPVHQHGGSQVTENKTATPTDTHTEHTGSGMKDMEMGTENATFSVPDAFKIQLDTVFEAYYTIHNALSHDSLEEAVKGSAQVQSSLEKVDMKLLKGEAHIAWMNELNMIKKNSGMISKARTIAAAREAFIPLSASLIRVVKKFGTTGTLGMYRFHCPMANDNKGADWLQNTAEGANPYFGSAMINCGTLEETISEGSISDNTKEHKH